MRRHKADSRRKKGKKKSNLVCSPGIHGTDAQLTVHRRLVSATGCPSAAVFVTSQRKAFHDWSPLGLTTSLTCRYCSQRGSSGAQGLGGCQGITARVRRERLCAAPPKHTAPTPPTSSSLPSCLHVFFSSPYVCLVK